MLSIPLPLPFLPPRLEIYANFDELTIALFVPQVEVDIQFRAGGEELEILVTVLIVIGIARLLLKTNSSSSPPPHHSRTAEGPNPSTAQASPRPAANPVSPLTQPLTSGRPIGQRTPPPSGDFTRSTQGFMPEDQCPCGGRWIKHVNRSNGGRFFGCSRYPACRNTRDRVLAEERCSRGHYRSISNTSHDSIGRRICLDCAPHAVSSSDGLGLSSNRRETCRNGHPRTADNTYIRPDGERECRICRLLAR